MAREADWLISIRRGRREKRSDTGKQDHCVLLLIAVGAMTAKDPGLLHVKKKRNSLKLRWREEGRQQAQTNEPARLKRGIDPARKEKKTKNFNSDKIKTQLGCGPGSSKKKTPRIKERKKEKADLRQVREKRKKDHAVQTKKRRNAFPQKPGKYRENS